MIEFNEEATPEQIQERIAQLQAASLVRGIEDVEAGRIKQLDINLGSEPPVTGKAWNEMTDEEQQALRDYYDNTDFSHLMETEGVWEYPEKIIWPDEPEQLELDLGVVPKWDDEKPYSAGQISLYFDRVITNHMWNEMVDVMAEAVTNKGWPEFQLSAIMKSGRDRDLFPEAYKDESEESDKTGEEKV